MIELKFNESENNLSTNNTSNSQIKSISYKNQDDEFNIDFIFNNKNDIDIICKFNNPLFDGYVYGSYEIYESLLNSTKFIQNLNIEKYKYKCSGPGQWFGNHIEIQVNISTETEKLNYKEIIESRIKELIVFSKHPAYIRLILDFLPWKTDSSLSSRIDNIELRSVLSASEKTIVEDNVELTKISELKSRYGFKNISMYLKEISNKASMELADRYYILSKSFFEREEYTKFIESFNQTVFYAAYCDDMELCEIIINEFSYISYRNGVNINLESCKYEILRDPYLREKFLKISLELERFLNLANIEVILESFANSTDINNINKHISKLKKLSNISVDDYDMQGDSSDIQKFSNMLQNIYNKANSELGNMYYFLYVKCLEESKLEEAKKNFTQAIFYTSRVHDIELCQKFITNYMYAKNQTIATGNKINEVTLEIFAESAKSNPEKVFLAIEEQMLILDKITISDTTSEHKLNKFFKQKLQKLKQEIKEALNRNDTKPYLEIIKKHLYSNEYNMSTNEKINNVTLEILAENLKVNLEKFFQALEEQTLMFDKTIVNNTTSEQESVKTSKQEDNTSMHFSYDQEQTSYKKNIDISKEALSDQVGEKRKNAEIPIDDRISATKKIKPNY